MRRTRILATLGPASDSPDTIRRLLEAGADAFRLNFSHGTHASHARACERVRQAAAADRHVVAILQDLAGPKIRVGPLQAPLALAEGDPLAIELGDFAGGPGRISTSFGALFTSVGPGHRLLVDDGRIEVRVEEASPGRLATRVVTGGILEGRKGINVPDVPLRTSALTEQDVADLRAGLEMGVDLVAVSFVQSADDVHAARAAAAAAGAPALPVVAKIEKPQAVEQIEPILDAADGIMIARGDLGIELPLETVPAVQKTIIQAARQRGVPVIVATEVLESMRSSPRPTRAEVTDAANAVGEGADAIMLAVETAAGRYPVRAVQILDAILREAEKTPAAVPVMPGAVGAAEHGRALAEAAVALATRARAAAIVALTEAGKTAVLLAALRPTARLIAATPNVRTAARLALVWGVTPVIAPEATLAAVREYLVAGSIVPSGSTVVFVSMHAGLGREDANFVHVERL